MTNQEILDQIAKMEKGLNNASLPESAKTAFKGKIAALKAELEKSEAKVEKKEEKVQAEEKKIHSELEDQIAKLEKGLTNKSLPESAKEAIRKKINTAKEELAKQKAEIKTDEKEADKEKKEVKAAVKKLAEVAKKAGKVKAKAIPKPEIKEKEREKKSEKRQTKLSGMMEELQALIHKNKFLASKYEGKGVNLDRDAHRPAKPFGYRFTGKDNYAVPTKEQIKKGLKDGTVDYEGRPNRADKTPKKEYKLAHGGDVDNENAEMVLSKAKELKHHADELENVVTPNSDIEAWEVAKMERASTDASDVTHYEDGKKGGSKYDGYMAKGGTTAERAARRLEKYKTDKWNQPSKGYSSEAPTKPTSDAQMKETMKMLLTKNQNSHSRAKARIELYNDGVVTDWKSYIAEYEERFGKQDADTVKKAKENYDNAEMMAKGGKLSKKAKYIPKRNIDSLEIDKNGKEVEVDGADLLDGIYVKKASYTKKVAKKGRPAKKATGGEVKPKSNRKGGKSVGEIAALAKQIRKEGEKWTDAIKRASAQLKAKM
jgi:hypothetical protein